MTEMVTLVHDGRLINNPFKVYASLNEPFFAVADIEQWVKPEDVQEMVDILDEREKLYAKTSSDTNDKEVLITEYAVYELLMSVGTPLSLLYKTRMRALLLTLRSRGKGNSRVLEYHESKRVGEFAKELIANYDVDLGRNKLFKKLREWNLVGMNNLPLDRTVRQGLLVSVRSGTRTLPISKRVVTTYATHITPKGEQYVLKKLGLL